MLSGLLIIPQVRAVAGRCSPAARFSGSSSASLRSGRSANFVAGIMIAFTQPLRIGDRIVVESTMGVVEEIGLMYTFVRSDDDTRLVIPNEKLASDTIHNSTIVDRAQRAEITVQVPLSADLDHVIDLLRSAGEGEREPRGVRLPASTAARRSRCARLLPTRWTRIASSTSSACAPTSGSGEAGVYA